MPTSGRTAIPRSTSFPLVVLAFLAGVLVAAVLVPSHDGDGGVAAPASSASAGLPVAETSAPAAAGDVGGAAVAAPPSGGAPVTGAAPQATSGTAAASPAAAPPSAAASGGSNGGATARGVTATDIKVGVANLDSSDLAPVCPRCSNGAGAQGAVSNALYAAWHRDGLLPINGRDITFVNRGYQVLSPEQQRQACVAFAQQDKIFAAVDDNQSSAATTQCLAQEFKIPVVTGTSQAHEDAMRGTKLWFQGAAGEMRVWGNWARWLDQQGLLKGQVVGLYSAGSNSGQFGVQGANDQYALDRSLRPALKALGVTLAVDMQSSGQQDAPVAVQRFRAAGVTVALILTNQQPFQTAAQQQAYRPKYPAADPYGLLRSDAVADIQWNADAMDGQLGFTQEWWDFSSRKPVVAKGNPAAQYCIDAYQRYTKRQLDTFDNDSEIRYLLEMCSALTIVRKAIELAGPNLTNDTFVQGMYRIKGLQTGAYPSVSYGPGKVAGGDVWHTAQFRKARWPVTNDYWGTVSPWQPFWQQY